MKKYIIAFCTLIASFLIVSTQVYANPPSILRMWSASATSTLAYLSPGAGTTTLMIDTGISANTAADNVTLLLQYTASGTAPTLAFRQEYSADNIDWYSETLVSSTSQSILVSPYREYSIVFSTTTASGRGGSGTSARQMTSLQLPVPTRYTRVVFYVPAGGGNGALWSEFSAKKQIY